VVLPGPTPLADPAGTLDAGMTHASPGASATGATASAGVALADGAVIHVADVRKAYGSVQAVDGVSFDVAKGEIFGLLGPNGAGKTTTMEMAEGLHEPDSGDVRVLGMDVRRSAQAIKSRIGVQLQTVALYPLLTVAELLALFGSFYEHHRPVDQLLEDLELGEKRDAQTKTLSGGQQQRLSVALALVNDPEVVFLDEPTTGLDPAARRSLWSVIRRMQDEGRTILMTTHYMEEAEALCVRLAIMDHGRILDSGTADELIGRRFQERGVRFDRTGAPDSAALAALRGVSSVASEGDEVVLYTRDVPGTIAGLLELTGRTGTEPANLMIRRASLEDVFLDLTGRALRD
jgi:ABC-2 type transport system ATP-binding protein